MYIYIYTYNTKDRYDHRYTIRGRTYIQQGQGRAYVELQQIEALCAHSAEALVDGCLHKLARHGARHGHLRARLCMRAYVSMCVCLSTPMHA